MDTKRENLKRNYDLFINTEQRLAFCRGLAGYLDYVFMSSPYKEVFEKQTTEYENALSEVMKLENRTLDEMIESKDDLAKIIKKNGLDVQAFERIQTMSFNSSTDLLQEFDGFLEGKAVGNGYRSDSLQNYLFDIGANLLVKGYEKDIKKYLVSDDEYAEHYTLINGYGSWQVRGNKHGNFIFSRTWAKRWHYVNSLEKKKSLVPWWSFVRLFQFKFVYDAVMQNRHVWELIADGKEDFNRLRTHDKVNMYHMAQDLESMIEKSPERAIYRNTSSQTIGAGLKSLNKDEMKAHLVTVHNILLQTEPSVAQNSSSAQFDAEKSRLHVADQEIKIRKFSDQYHALRIMFENPSETGKEWFFSEIAERADKENQNDKRYYNAIYQVTQKLKSCGLTDCFVTTRQSVKMAKKYLS